MKAELPFVVEKPSYANFDTTNINNDIWMTRVGDYLSESWKRNKKKTLIGKIKIETFAAGKPPNVKVLLDKGVDYGFSSDLLPDDYLIVPNPPPYSLGQYIFNYDPLSGYVKMLGHVHSPSDLKTNDIDKAFLARNAYQESLKYAKVKKSPKTIVDFEENSSIKPKSKIPTKRPVKDRVMRKTDQEIQYDLFQLFKSNPELSMQDLSGSIKQSPEAIRPVLCKIAKFDDKLKKWKLLKEFMD